MADSLCRREREMKVSGGGGTSGCCALVISTSDLTEAKDFLTEQ